MNIKPGFFAIIALLMFGLQASKVSAREWLVRADIDARAEYNDNIFLTPLPHDSVNGLILTPSIKGVVKEAHWQADLAARLRSNNYSDTNLNSNDKYFDLTGKYNAERNIFSLNVNYDLDSNLNATSPDFGIVVGRRVKRKNQNFTPSYSRLVSERLFMTLSYTYADVDYIDAENTGYVPYRTQSGYLSFVYNLTEKDRFTFSLSAVDYKSKDEFRTYQLYMPRLGIEHDLSSTLLMSFSAGTSRRNSTNLSTTSFDFFGQPIPITREIDATDKGFVLDATVVKKHETGSYTGSLVRDNTTSSFGGLNQVDRLKVGYNARVTELWRYNLNGRYEDYTAISSGTRNTDRKVLFLEGATRYTLSRHWDFNLSYRFVQRRFKNDTSDNRAPYSNRIYASLTYNFPELSTF